MMLSETLREAATRFGDRPCLVEPEGATLTFGALHLASERLARQLAQAGIREGDVVALQLPSNFDYVISYCALARLGAITAGLNPHLAAGEQARILDMLQPRVVVGIHSTSGGSWPAYDIAEFDIQHEVDKPQVIDPAELEPLAELPPDPERPVAIVLTSGTTGLPKGALFRNSQLEAISRIDLGPNWAEVWGIGGAQIASTQFAHIGFMTKLPWYIRCGMATYLLPKWRTETVMELIDAHRITTLGVIAPQLAILLRHEALPRYDLSSVDLIIAGGAASPPALITAASQRFGARYSVRYSSTESGGVGLSNDAGSPEDQINSVLFPREGVEAGVFLEDGTEAGAGVIGELRLRSDAMFDGYWNDPESTQTAVRTGWLHTGDLAQRTPSGGIQLTGRHRDRYVRGGYNVYPTEVEAVLLDHPSVADVAVVPLSHEVLGSIGAAVVVPTAGAQVPTLAELREFCIDRLATWKHPEALVLAESLPYTSGLKLDRAQLASIVAQEDSQ